VKGRGLVIFEVLKMGTRRNGLERLRKLTGTLEVFMILLGLKVKGSAYQVYYLCWNVCASQYLN
jgi:hypothetical protein